MSDDCGLEGIQAECGQIFYFFKTNQKSGIWGKSPNFLNIDNKVSNFKRLNKPNQTYGPDSVRRLSLLKLDMSPSFEG